MPNAPVIKVVLRELVSRRQDERVPEPDLVMDDPEKVAAFTKAGEVVIAPTYLFHCAQVCELLRPGDQVVDLGCGSARQLAMIARLNPAVRFLGLDLSAEMLRLARDHVEELGLGNVEFREADITRLDFLPERSVDVVISTMTLHHLPDLDHLDRTFAEAARVLEDDGAVYLTDFGRLKSEKSIRDMAYLHAEDQPEPFTIDYLNSLRAAFTVSEFRAFTERHLAGRARLYATFPMPLMIAVKSPRRNPDAASLAQQLAAIRDGFSRKQATDLGDLTSLFRLGGLQSTLLRA